MRSSLSHFFRIVSVCSCLLLGAVSAKAQCGVNTLGFGNVGIVSGNPFHAEITVVRTGPPKIADIHPLSRTRLVARDSQGRVRDELVTGEFKHDTGPEAGTQTVAHMIRICDTGAQTLTEIDTLNSIAKIRHSVPSARSVSPADHPRTFCSSRMPSGRNPNMTVEDLGYQTIEGVQAHGVRVMMKPLLAPSGDNSFGETITELWCSDDLSAVVLRTTQSTKSELKTTIAMKNIERSEPDPAIFQIPPDYAVTESVPQSRASQTPNLQSNELH
jgi:hypothetical protein